MITKNHKTITKASAILLIALAIICAGLVITGEPAFAETTDDGWIYEEAGDDTLRITGYEGGKSEVEVPAMIGEKAVREIGAGAFTDVLNLKTIIVPEGITTIGEEAFANCPNLNKVELPDTVTSIGRRAFRYNYSLKSAAWPSRIVRS